MNTQPARLSSLTMGLRPDCTAAAATATMTSSPISSRHVLVACP
jgi:hypothetical protein